MPYRLLKTRINTNFSRIVKPFKTTQAFADWLADAALDWQIKVPFADNSLESASVQYDLVSGNQPLYVEVRLMQSTRQTSYCFDVFIVIHFATYDDAVAKIVDLCDTRLSALRRQYNGDWIIDDKSLTLSCLR